MNVVLEEGLVEILDPLDVAVVDVSFTAREIYTVLEALYFDTANDPYEVLGVIKYLEDRLQDLRNKYKETGEAKWRHKYEEVQRMLEHSTIKSIDREQKVPRNKYKPTAGGRAYKFEGLDNEEI